MSSPSRGIRGNIPGRVEAPLLPVIERYELDLAGSILELGPGNGQLKPLVKAAGGEYTSVDYDPRAKPDMVLDYAYAPHLLPRGKYSGIFCRGSIGVMWPNLDELAIEISERMQPWGWAWLALWTDDLPREEAVSLAMQAFMTEGFNYDPSYDVSTTRVLVRR